MFSNKFVVKIENVMQNETKKRTFLKMYHIFRHICKETKHV